MHESSAFVTLTYDEDHVPPDGSVSPDELQAFVKRLREHVRPERIRFYGVGEYGDFGNRPHYHLLLFGLPLSARLTHRHPAEVEAFGLAPCRCAVCKAWGKGGVDVDEVNAKTARYVAKYAIKQCTRGDDPRLEGRFPEFARMSNRPGIGAAAMSVVQAALTTKGGVGAVAVSGDVPGSIRLEQKVWPLGRYLRGRLRQEMGMDKRMPIAAAERLQLEKVAELLVEGARDAREQKRVQVERTAMARHSIAKTKRGL